jgi:hypothetical protein
VTSDLKAAAAVTTIIPDHSRYSLRTYVARRLTIERITILASISVKHLDKPTINLVQVTFTKLV